MILFINNFITNKVRTPFNRFHFPRYDKLDIYKYMLASYSVLPFTKVIIYTQLDHDFAHRRQELDDFIRETFDPAITSVYHTRNEVQAQWKIALEEVDNDPANLVWFSCNDDHIFLDYQLEHVKEGMEILQQDPHSSIYYSHWPELLKTCRGNYSHGFQNHGNFVSFHWNHTPQVCSIQLLRKELLHAWWFDSDYGNTFLPRSDWDTIVTSPDYTCYVPLREWCRHFDGYGHIQFDSHNCPPLSIPPGFFEKDIKILYCSKERRPGWYNIDPTATEVFGITGRGPDERFLLEDIPLFWKDRISKIEVAEVYDAETLRTHRNNYYKARATPGHNSAGLWYSTVAPDEEWIRKSYR